MELSSLLNLQGMLYLMIFCGVVLRRIGIIDDAGKRCLTDVTIGIIIPCNIVRSFMGELGAGVLRACALLLVGAALLQVVSVGLNQVLYRRQEPRQRGILQYATICTNAGFMGNPLAEGLWGETGLLYTSVFLIPMRIVMWSVGVSYFAKAPNRKQVVKQVLTHPCIVAVYIGLVLMLLSPPLPVFLVSTITGIGGCNSAMTMIIIGAILADVDPRTIFSGTAFYFSGIRLLLMPLIALVIYRALGLDSIATGVGVLMTGMPAGSTTAIFAAKYDSDAPFAIRCFVCSMLLSLLTIPMWGMIIG